MKKFLIIGIITVVVFSLIAVPVYAAKKDNPANDNPNNLYLYEKDTNWEIVWDGAWGKLNYKLDESSLDFVFNGHKLEKNTGYSLIVYEDWPNAWVLAEGTTNNGGNIHLSGIVGPDDAEEYVFTAWNPSEYLFEHHLLIVDDGEIKIWLVLTEDLDEEPTEPPGPGG